MKLAAVGALLVGLFMYEGCSFLGSSKQSFDEWREKASREAAAAAREIKEDWNLHEDEGLRQFGGGALEQVRELRGELDRSATLSTN